MNIVSTCTATLDFANICLIFFFFPKLYFLLKIPLHVRILDNLPLVVPVRRLDQESPPIYQLGYFVGVKGQPAVLAIASKNFLAL